MQSVARQIAAVKRSAEKMDATAPERIGSPSVGDVVRQGDLYLVCLASLPESKDAATRQLAPGETQGSRHIVDGDCRVVEPIDRSAVANEIARVVKGASVPEQLVGPLVECRGETTVTHPEHGHKILPAGTTWATVYQRAYAEEVRRVQD